MPPSPRRPPRCHVSSHPNFKFHSYCTVSLPLPLLLAILLLSAVTAVDRSKFRTCGQTSFCRRHRHGKSRSLYDYKLLPNSVAVQQPQEAASSPGFFSQFSRRILGTPSPPNTHFRGPVPLFSARLVNTAPFTSTALTARASVGESRTEEEELQLTIHVHQDGVARVRITEKDASSRWTADDLVLNDQEMISAQYATVHTVNEEVRRVLEVPQNDKVKEREAREYGERDPTEDQKIHRSIASLVQRAAKSTMNRLLNTSNDNFILLSYGCLSEEDQGDTTPQEHWKLLLQLEPFAVYFFRGTAQDGTDKEDDSPPLVVAGTNGLTHFEIRRSKEGSYKKDSDSLEETNKVDGEKERKDDDRHGGKKIIGYWEDGLAIYADGTREERREEIVVPGQEEQDMTADLDKGEGGRRLMEESFDTEGMWEETFGGHQDSKPHGPMSVGMQLTFPSSRHLFGLPEHASSTQLKTTSSTGGDRESQPYYKEPYRLYNLDVFEYDLDETMALYGHIPLVISQSAKMGTVGAFWFNPTETFVDVEESLGLGDEDDDVQSRTHFISESGIIDLFLLPGPDPATLYAQYARLTGRTSLPPMFSLGYHQCRWNYRDEADVYFVHNKFEELDYPYDVLWLDIEHTDGKRYFTWDDKLFPNPEEMQKKLKHDGRRMVTIVDPHIKRDTNYYIHKEATSLGLYIKDKNGEKHFDGWCWPGSSSYLDFTDEKVRNWWADQFRYNKYKGSTPDLFIWNDMNEPSVFNGPEVSMQKDLLNLNNCEHREWHNLYGMLFHRATSEGLIRRNAGENVRPFVLSRSFFAGSQRYGAIWTGDNAAEWSYLEIATPMLLSLNIGALSFVGADVGGFFGNPDAELMTRWMQAGAYQPFFRGHAHHDSKRREPWMFGDDTLVRLRRAAMARYALLPYWYTVFWYAGVTGMPVMRAMWMQYPNTPELYSVDNQFLIGSDLLIKPVTSAGATTTDVQFPLLDSWYDVDTMQKVPVTGDRNTAAFKKVESGIDKIPVYQRGGSIIPRKLRLRRSSSTMTKDPYTLYVALNEDFKAEGVLYIDDETTFDHVRKDDYAVATFSADWGKGLIAIQNSVKAGNKDGLIMSSKNTRIVERIIIMGVPGHGPRGIELFSVGSSQAVAIDFQYDSSTNILVIRKPEVSALDDWTMRLKY